MAITAPRTPRRGMLRALALATLPLVAGYTPVRPLPHSVVAQGRLRTLSSRMAADYSGLSYRELQQACKAQGLKATGKADLLRERLAGQADEPAGAPPAGTAPAESSAAATPDLDLEEEFIGEEEPAPPLRDDDIGLEIAPPLSPDDYDDGPMSQRDIEAASGNTEAAAGEPLDEMGDDLLDDLLGDQAWGLEGWPEEGGGAPAVAAGGGGGGAAVSGGGGVAASTTDWLDELFGGVDAPDIMDALSRGGDGFSADASLSSLLGDEEDEEDEEDGGGGDARPARPARQPRAKLSEQDSLREAIMYSRDAGKVLNMMGKWRRRGYGAEAALYRAALRAAAQEGAWQVAAALLNDLEASDFEASTELYELAIRACDQKKKWQEAVALLERMEQRAVPLSCRAFEVRRAPR